MTFWTARLLDHPQCGRQVCPAQSADGEQRSESHGLNAELREASAVRVSPEWIYGGTSECVHCHSRAGRVRFRAPPARDATRGIAPGYRHVLHRLCIDCHRVVEAERGIVDAPVLTRCGGCHPEDAGREPGVASDRASSRTANRLDDGDRGRGVS